ALEEAAKVVEEDLGDPKRALDLAGRALRETIAADRARAPDWMSRVDRLAAATRDASRGAAAFVGALGDRPSDDELTFGVGGRAGEARAVAGDAAGAIATFRRALAFSPSSAELLTRVDGLLEEQGSPGERLALYQSALEQPCDPKRRRELLHAI